MAFAKLHIRKIGHPPTDSIDRFQIRFKWQNVASFDLRHHKYSHN